MLAGCSAGPPAGVGTPVAPSISVTADEVSAAVKQSMQQEFDTGHQVCTDHLQVEDVVVHAVGNAYQGTVTCPRRKERCTTFRSRFRGRAPGSPGGRRQAPLPSLSPRVSSQPEHRCGTGIGSSWCIVSGGRRWRGKRRTGPDQVTAKGEFVIVDLTVTKVGEWAQAYDATRQQLLVDCTAFTAGPLAMVYLTPATTRPIDPGVSVRGADAVRCAGGLGSGGGPPCRRGRSTGVSVDLEGLPIPPP